MICDPEEIEKLYRETSDAAHKTYLKERLTPEIDTCSREWQKVWEEGLAHGHRVAIEAVFEAGKEHGIGIMSHLA